MNMNGLKAIAAMLVTVSAILTGGCSSTLMPYTADSTPLVMMPLATAGIEDQRGRFREIFCAVLDARGDELPDIRPCTSALTMVGTEPAGSKAPVPLGKAVRPLTIGSVPGVGWTCVARWLESATTADDNLRRFGYDLELITVDALSSGIVNARQIRDWVLDFANRQPERELVLLGYSKGGPDVLRAVAEYAEIRPHVKAVISVAGSVGGSPLAHTATQGQLELLSLWPDAECDKGDGQGLASLAPEVRRDWLAENPLPADIPYYSVVTYPAPDRISSVLRSTWRKLARVDARNDSQVLFYDQVIPASTLVAYLNADHWAVAVPIARAHSTIARLFVDKNDFPREALLEAIARFVDEDLSRQASAQ
jgi:hypothetical protein